MKIIKNIDVMNEYIWPPFIMIMPQKETRGHMLSRDIKTSKRRGRERKTKGNEE